MAIVTGEDMLARLRETVGAENDTHVTNPELYRALTYGAADTWDTILSMGIGTEGVKKVDFTLVAGGGAMSGGAGAGVFIPAVYSVGNLAPDFYQVSRILVVEQDGRLRPLSRVNPSEQYALRPAKEAVTIRMYYFPTSTIFVDGSEYFDGINGWEEHAIMNAAIYVKTKKEDDTGQFRARKREIEARMAVMVNRLRDEPPRIVRRASPARRGYAVPYTVGVRAYDLPYTVGVRAYDLRGTSLEFFS